MPSRRDSKRFSPSSVLKYVKPTVSMGTWLTNAGKSLGVSAMDVIKETLPATFENIENAAELVQDFKQEITDMRAVEGRVSQALDLSFWKDNINRAKNDTLESIRTGKLYSSPYDFNDEDFGDFGDFDGFGDDDFEFDENFDTETVSEDGITSVTTRHTKGKDVDVNQVNVNVNVGEDSTLVKATNAQTEVNAELSQTHVETVKKSTQILDTSLYQLRQDLGNVMKSMDSNIASIASVTTSIGQSTALAAQYYNDSMGVFNSILESLNVIKEGAGSNLMGARDPVKEYNDILDMFSGNGVLDIKQYGQLVSKQLQSALDSNFFTSTIKGFLSDKDTVASFFKHPVNMVVESFTKTIIPSILRESAKKFDETLTEFAIAGLTQVGALENSDNEIFRMLGTTFGIKNKLKKDVDKANYKRGKVDWDGQSHKTLNEIIPYYLRKITSALTGEREVGFDFEKGTFRDVKDMADEYNANDRKRMLSGHSSFISDFKSYINSAYQFTNTKDSERLTKYMEDFMYKMVNSPANMRRKKVEGFDKNSFAQSIADAMGSRVDDSTVKVVASFFDNLSNAEVMQAFGRNILDARAAMSRYKTREESGEILTNGMYVNNGTTIDPLYDKDTGNTQYNKAKSFLIDRDEYGHTPVYYQRKILELLAVGIKVYPQSYSNGIFGDSSTPNAPTDTWSRILDTYAKDKVEKDTEDNRISKLKSGVTIDPERVQSGVNKGKIKLDVTGIDSLSQFNADAAAAEWIKNRNDEDKEDKPVTLLERIANVDNPAGKLVDKFMEYLKKPSQILSDMFKKADNFLFSIIFGGETGVGGSAFKRAMDFMKRQFKTFGNWLNDKIFIPLQDTLFGDNGIFAQIKQSQMWQDVKGFFANTKVKLFGETDANGNYTGGFFSDFANDLSGIGSQVKDFFFGDNEDSVLSHIKSAGRATVDMVLNKFGYDAEASRAKTEETGKGPITRMLDTVSETVKSRVNTTMDSILGPDDPENQRRQIVEMLKDDVRGKGSKFAAGAAVGIVGSFFTPFGPVGGALLGMGTTLVNESEALKQALFGKRDLETGERQGGLISKDLIDAFNDNKTGIKLGVAAGVISKFGIIPSFMLPGGPIGGALIGGAASMVWHLDAVQRYMYGYEGEDGEHVDGFFDKMKAAFGEDYKKLGIDAGIGAGVGAIGGLLLPTGPLLGAVIGASTGIALQSEKVKDFIFGEADEKGIRSGGLISKITETITGPVRKTFAIAQVKFMGWLEQKVLSPLGTAFAPLVDEGKRIVQNIKDGVKNLVDGITNSVNRVIIKPVADAFKNLFQPAIDATKKITTGFLKVVGGILTSPIKVLQVLGYGLNRKHMREGERGYYDQTIGNAFTVSRKKRKKMGLSETASFWERLSSFGSFFGGFLTGEHKNAKFSDKYGGAGYAAEFNGKKISAKKQNQLQIKESKAWRKYQEEILKADPKHKFTKEERADFDKKHNLYSGLWKKTASKKDDSKIDIKSADITAQNININSKALGDFSEYLQKLGKDSPYQKYKEAMKEKGLYAVGQTEWITNKYAAGKEYAAENGGFLPDMDKFVTSSVSALTKEQRDKLKEVLNGEKNAKRKRRMYADMKKHKARIEANGGKFDPVDWKRRYDKLTGGPINDDLQEMDITKENMNKIKGKRAKGGWIKKLGAYILSPGEKVIPSGNDGDAEKENKFFNRAKKDAEKADEKKQDKLFDRLYSKFTKKDKTQEAKEKAAQTEADELKKTQSAGSYETKAKIAEEKAKESKLQKWRDSIIETISSMKESASEHFERWKEIFGPKGKIALAILALSPVVAGIADIVRKMLDGMKFGDAVKEYFGDLGKKYFGPDTFIGRMIARIKKSMEPLPAIWDNIKETGKAFMNIFTGKDGNFFTRIRDFIFPKDEKGENQYTGKSDILVNAGIIGGGRAIRSASKAGIEALGEAIDQARRYEQFGDLRDYNWINKYDDGLDIFHKAGKSIKKGVKDTKNFIDNKLFGTIDNTYVANAAKAAKAEALAKGEPFSYKEWSKKYLKKAKEHSRRNDSIFDDIKKWRRDKKQAKIDKINANPKSLKYKLRNNPIAEGVRDKFSDFKNFMTKDLIYETDDLGRRAADTISQSNFKYTTNKVKTAVGNTRPGKAVSGWVDSAKGTIGGWKDAAKRQVSKVTDPIKDTVKGTKEKVTKKVRNKIVDAIYGKETMIDNFAMDPNTFSKYSNALGGSSKDMIIDMVPDGMAKSRQGGFASTWLGKKIFKNADRADDILNKGVASTVDDVLKSNSVTNKVSGVVGKALDAVKKLIGKIVKKFTGKSEGAGKFAGKLQALFQKVMGFFSKGGKAIAKYGQKILGAVAKGAAVVTVVWGVLSGPAGAANLFGVREDEVDTKMKVISTIWSTIQTIPLGVGSVAAVIEIISEVVAEFTGVNFVREVSTLLYGLISSEDDKLKLQDSQDKFMNEYQTMLNSATYEEYQKNAKAQGIKNVLSEKDWNKSKEMNFEEFNDAQNKTLGAKLSDKLGGVKKVGKKALNFAKNQYKEIRNTHATDLFTKDYWTVNKQKEDGTLKTEEELMREKVGKVVKIPLVLIRSVLNFHIEKFEAIIKGTWQTIKDFGANTKTALDAIKDGTSVFKQSFWEAPKVDDKTDTGNLTSIAFYLNRILLFVPGLIIGIGKSIGRGIGSLVDKVKTGWTDVMNSFKFSDIQSTSDIIKGDYWKAPSDENGDPMSPMRRAIFYATKLVLFVPAIVIGMVKDLGRALDPVMEPIKKVTGPFIEKLKGLFTKDGKDPGAPKEKGMNQVMYWTAKILGFVPKVVTTVFDIASTALTPIFNGIGVLATSVFTGMEQIMGANITKVFSKSFWQYNAKNEGQTRELNGFDKVMFFTGRILALPIWAATFTIQKVVALTGPIITSIVSAIANIITQTKAVLQNGTMGIFTKQYWDIKNPTKGEFSGFEKVVLVGFKVLTLPIFAIVGIIRDIVKGVNPVFEAAKVFVGYPATLFVKDEITAVTKGVKGVFNPSYFSFKEDANDPFSGLKKVLFWATKIATFPHTAVLAVACDIGRVIGNVAKGIINVWQYIGITQIDSYVQVVKGGIGGLFKSTYWDPHVEEGDSLGGFKKILFYIQKIAMLPHMAVIGLTADVARGIGAVVKGVIDISKFLIKTDIDAAFMAAKNGVKTPFTKEYWTHNVEDGESLGGLKKVLFYIRRFFTIPAAAVIGITADISRGVKKLVDKVIKINDDWNADTLKSVSLVKKSGIVAIFSKDYWTAKDDKNNEFSGLRKVLFYTNRIMGLPMNAIIGVIESAKTAVSNIIDNFKKTMSVMGDVNDIDVEKTSWGDYFKKGKPKEEDGLGLLGTIGFWISRIVYAPVFFVKKLISKVSGPIGDAIDKVKGFFGLGGDGDLDGLGGNGDPNPKVTKKPQGGFGQTLPDIQNGFPYYSQNDDDLRNKPYRLSKRKDKEEGPNIPETMGNRGCGPTAMAMVASSVMGGNGNPYSPENMANLATKGNYSTNVGTTPNYFTGVGTKLGMNVTPAVATASNINTLLRNGDPAIIQGASDDPNTPYTSSGHYVVAVGLDRDGNVIVNDPRGREYSRAYSMKDIQKGSVRAWGFSRGSGKVGSTGSHLSGSKPARVLRMKGGNGSSWINVVRAVKEAIAAQKPGYSQSRYITINVNGKTIKVRTDCSGLVSACLAAYGAIPSNKYYRSATLVNKDDATLTKSGMFTAMDFPGWDNLKEGDILVVNGHTEIFSRNDGNKHYVYNAGSTSSINNPGETRSSKSTYKMIWRCNGAASATDTSYSTSGSVGFISAMNKFAEAMASPIKKLLYGEEASSDSTMSSDGTVSGVTPNSGADGNYSSNYSGNASKPFSSTNATKNAFVPKILAKSVQSGAQYGIFPSIKLSQAALESKWGQSGLATKGKNLFGIKAGSSWKGATINMRTGEQRENGSKYMTDADFRKYSSWDESIDDHSKLLATKHYDPVRHSKNYVEAAKQLKACNYATALDYADSLISTIKANNFSYYDRPEGQTEFLGSVSTAVDGGTETGSSSSGSSSSTSKGETNTKTGNNTGTNSGTNKNGYKNPSTVVNTTNNANSKYVLFEYDIKGSNGKSAGHRSMVILRKDLKKYWNNSSFIKKKVTPVADSYGDNVTNAKNSQNNVKTSTTKGYRKVVYYEFPSYSGGQVYKREVVIPASQLPQYYNNKNYKVLQVLTVSKAVYDNYKKTGSTTNSYTNKNRTDRYYEVSYTLKLSSGKKKKLYQVVTGNQVSIYSGNKKYYPDLKIKEVSKAVYDNYRKNPTAYSNSKGGKGGFGDAVRNRITSSISNIKSIKQPTPPINNTMSYTKQNDNVGDPIGGFGDTGSYTTSSIPKMKTPTAPTVSTQTYKPAQQSYRVNTNYTQMQRTLDSAERLSRETAAYDDANVVSGINELINGMQMLVTEMRGTNAGVNKFNEKELVVNSTPVVYSPTTNNITAPQQPQQQQKNVQKSSFLDQASYTMARNIASGGL